MEYWPDITVNLHKSALMFHLYRQPDGPMRCRFSAWWWAGSAAVLSLAINHLCVSRSVLRESSRRAKLRVSWDSCLNVFVDGTFRFKRSDEWSINDFKRMHFWDQGIFSSSQDRGRALTRTRITQDCVSVGFEQNLNL